MKNLREYASWLKLTFLLVCGVPVVIGYFWPRESDQTAGDFAARLRTMIVEKRVDAFQALPCQPAGCIDEQVVEQVFGSDGREGFVRRFLMRPDITVRVYEPFSLEQLMDGSDYLFLYFDPIVARFGERGYLSERDRRTLWRKSYIETRISLDRGEWRFHGSPFLSRPRIAPETEGSLLQRGCASTACLAAR